MADLQDRRRTTPRPLPEDAAVIRGLITEFVLITPAATEIDDIGFIFFDTAPSFAISRLAAAFPKITVAERVILARFVLYYAPDNEDNEDIIARATDTMVMLALAERDALSARLCGLTAIDRLGKVMINGQPPEMGLWLAYVVIKHLADQLGDDHYLVTAARDIIEQRNPR